MKKKKFYAKAAAALMTSTLILAGCGSTEQGSSGAAQEDQVTVDIYQFKVEFKNQFETLAEKYEEENPGVNINVETVGGGNDYSASLKTAFSSEAPDIFNMGGPSDIEDYREYLEDLSGTAAAEAALDGTLTPVSDGEEVLALPYNQEGYGLLYNKTVFEEAGINPDEILTMKDLEAAVAKIDNQKEELGLDAVFALPGTEKWVLGMHLANAYLTPEFDHDALNAFQAETVAFEKGDEMKQFLDLQNEYSVQPVMSIDYSQQVEEYFSLEKVALIQQGNWVYNTLLEMDPEFAENNVGILPIPVEGFEGKIPVGVPNYWAVNAESDDAVVEASKDFLDWMYTSETGKETVLKDFKFIPAYEGYDTSQIADPISREIYNYASEGNTIGWVFSGTPVAWNEEVLAVNMQKYLSEEITWEEVESLSRDVWEESRK